MSTMELRKRAVKPRRRPRRLKMTEEEFDNWHDEFLRGEWVDGEVELMSPVRNVHAQLNLLLATVLQNNVEQRRLGEIRGPGYAIRFAKLRRRRVPDLFFVASENLSRIQETYFEGAPDAVFEIVSPDSIGRDWRVKFDEYNTAGVREYWIIDPKSKIVEAYRRLKRGGFRLIEPTGDRIASRVIEGFFLKPAWLWREPLPQAFDLLRELGVLPAR